MEGITSLRLIHDPPHVGLWNMAVDEMMLETVAVSGVPILRFYAWAEPTLSLGYFQALEDRQSHVASLQCPIVRRSTGGGAILHDHEITYSIALPLVDRWSSAATALYDTFHAGLVAALAQLDISATLCPQTLHTLQPEFLCFQRRAKGDVLVAGHKVAGSAQRRRATAMLQHGSVILSRSKQAPEVLGLQLTDREIAVDQLLASWIEQIQGDWPSLRFLESQWTATETGVAQATLEGRFASSDWLVRRT